MGTRGCSTTGRGTTWLGWGVGIGCNPIGRQLLEWELNFYRYCATNPGSFVDPMGHQSSSFSSVSLLAFAVALVAAGIVFALPRDSVKATIKGVVIRVATGTMSPQALGDIIKILGLMLFSMLLAAMVAEATTTAKCCPPCPPPPPPETHWDHPHGDCPGIHWHYFRYNQDPETCKCYLQRIFGGCGPAPIYVP